MKNFTITQVKKFLLWIILFSLFPHESFLLGQYHPEIKWYEIHTPHFIIVFPQGYENEADFAGETAEEIHGYMTNLWQTPLKKKTRILLNDASDEANGWASMFPFNMIEVNLCHPLAHLQIGGTYDWIRLVLSHELVHIINLNMAGRFSLFMRKIFGHHPLFYPMVYAPLWLTEGLAVYGESLIDPGGRLHTPDYQIMLQSLAAANRIPSLKRIYGTHTRWPGGQSPYLFGSAFIQFLVKHYGQQKVVEFVHFYVSDLIRVNNAAVFKLFFGQNYSHLWNSYIQELKQSLPKSFFISKSIIGKGFNRSFPVVIKEDQFVVFASNYTQLPALNLIDMRTGANRKLIEKRDINGLSYSAKDQSIYFSAADYYRYFYYYSDIYRYDLHKKKTVRLSTGKRLFSPQVIHDKIYCIKRIKLESFLCIYNDKKKDETVISSGYEAISSFSSSTDNQFLAASIKAKNQPWRIGIFQLDGELIGTIEGSVGKCFFPQWRRNDEVFFITEFEKSYYLACFNLKTKKMHIFKDDRIPVLHNFSFFPDKEKIIFTYFAPEGMDVGQVVIGDLKSIETRADFITFNESNKESQPISKTLKIKKYTPWRDLLPKFYSPFFRQGGNEIQPGFFSSGNDMLYNHQYQVQGFYGFASKSLNLDLSYTLYRFFPILDFRYRFLNDYNNEEQNYYVSQHNIIEFTGFYPLIKKNEKALFLFGDIHFDKRLDKSMDSEISDKIHLNGFKLGVLYQTAKNFYDAISLSDGCTFSLGYRYDGRFLDSDYNIHLAWSEFKQYLSLFRPNVLALRLGFAHSWGEARHLLPLGGNGSHDYLISNGTDLFHIMRGFAQNYRVGTKGWILNLEYRISLLKIETAVLASASFDRLFISLFTDMGNVWQGEKSSDFLISMGLEVNLIVNLGIPFQISGGIAKGMKPVQEARFYFRLGKSF